MVNPLPARGTVAASRLQLPPGPWTSMLDCLCARFPAISRAHWLDRIARGRVLDANGTPIAVDAPYRVGAQIRYFREVADEAPIAATESVLYADAHLVVADKPHGLPVTPAGKFVSETLLRRLIHRLDNPDLVPLHRIDRATAGLVLFSANPRSRAAYHALFRERGIDKGYEALARPLPALTFPLTRRSRLLRGEPFFRMREGEGEPNSESRVAVIERGEHLWRYALTPLTGRKHQLRVHMAALGAPIINDRCYPVLCDANPDGSERPLQLLAKSLTFVDPLDGRQRRFESALTLDLLHLAADTVF
ncbi:MAG: pseudouridine synthase [Xanthomonadaceae bacterium]|nr:pseudouridine synthase [Xanthomonadaceae bacterium]MDP2186020.1 pseudouridine synthase [Xanthomonadales bacterium]MDZ4117610.1 pseudouridine synthase [Xanthomonadaceae bacterium]MDZ4377554.1 pseudouridine synthase [Xanthomonadaceae bacterium]